MKYEMVGLCETGLVRNVNQDAVFWGKTECGAVCVVADGMGGHSHGEVASNLIKQTVLQCWETFTEENCRRGFCDMLDYLKCELEKANQALYQEYGKKRMCGSTLVLLFCFQNQYGILYAGDSRIYLKKGFSFIRLTTDEVWENQKNIPKEERQNTNHPNYGKLVNAFGSEADLHMRMMTDVLRGGELFLLCSDGLYKMCTDKQIKAAMRSVRSGGDGMKAALMRLKEETEEAGATDNFSIIMLKTDRE